MDEWPSHFSYTEKDLDTHFIGQWDIHYIDDYGAVKAGSISRSVVVRSQVDIERGIIKFVASIPDKHCVTDVIMDGSAGFYGKISERAMCNDGEVLRVDFLFIKLLSTDSILKECHQTMDGYRVWRVTAEIDDIVYNQDKTYTYPFYYFGHNNPPKLVGMTIEMPISHFNHYVRMRNLWYRDYKGSLPVYRSYE